MISSIILGTSCTETEDTVSRDPEIGPADITPQDGGVGPPYQPCTNHSDCPSGLACEYWGPGCNRRGECRPMLTALDAHASCFGVCGCEGYWLGNTYTDFPYQYIDWRGEQPCVPTDGGVPDGWTGYRDGGPLSFCTRDP